ncbi:RTA1-like protein [Mycena kentingensis (nom. inval.)]|nr:RTA1-like protein [Mycena kentingensis (nom. inval.)]
MSTNAAGPDPSQIIPYGHIPHSGIAILFLTLFGISTIAHFAQAVHFRMWWLIPTACLCGIGEIIGWSGRYWSSQNPTASDPFMIQITCTIISPTPLIAVSFVLLSRLIERLGSCYSRLSPKAYTIIFVSSDITALFIQGAGGGIAASSETESGNQLGSNVMLAGIVVQFVALCAYIACGADFLRNYLTQRPVRAGQERGEFTARLKILVYALGFSTTVLFIRSVYRIVELADGWTGSIITTEAYFNALDGGMVVLAIYTLNIAHPGVMLAAGKGSPDYIMQHLAGRSSTSI